MIDEIEPIIRFCAYKLSLDVSQGVEILVEEIVAREGGKLVGEYQSLFAAIGGKEGEGARRNVGDIAWRGAEIKVRNAQLVDVIVKVKEVLGALARDATGAAVVSEEKGKAWGKRKQKVGMDTTTNAKDVMDSRRMGMYDKALLVLSDAEGIARQLVDDNKVSDILPFPNSTTNRYDRLHFLEDNPLDQKRRRSRSSKLIPTSSTNFSPSARNEISSLSRRPLPSSRTDPPNSSLVNPSSSPIPRRPPESIRRNSK